MDLSANPKVGWPRWTALVALSAAALWRFGSADHPPPVSVRCSDFPTHADCFAYVPGGTFWMGAQSTDPEAPGFDSAAEPHEGPVRQVTVASFWLAWQEQSTFTVGQCRDAGYCPPAERGQDGVTFEEAEQACAWLGGRLPTEEEWEYAARGPESRRFPWGSTPPCSIDPLAPFARLPESQWGLIPGCADADPPVWPGAEGPFGHERMAWFRTEWVAGSFGDGLRVLRGATKFVDSVDDLRASARTGSPPDVRLPDIGFRCAW